jgi:outer membrane protein TolC
MNKLTFTNNIPMRTRNLCLLLFLLTGSHLVVAQTNNRINYDKIILPAISDTTGIKEKVVFLAWQNNPQIRHSELNAERAELQVKLARSQWLSAFNAAGNLNEFNIGSTFGNDTGQQGNIFFPRYNFGVGITFDFFGRVSNNVKIAKKAREIAAQDYNMLKLQIRAEALTKYQIYYTARELFRFQQEIAEDAYVKYLSLEQQFKNGERTLEEYEAATRTYKNAQIMRLTSERDYFIAKYDLEKLIGIPIEQVK